MKKAFSMFLLSFFLISVAGFAFAAGLVPCGNPGQKACTICDFFVLISNVVNFILFDIVPFLAVLLLAVGGFMYMIAYAMPGQGPGLISRAKSVLVSTLIGLVIIYGAFIIVGTFLSLIGLNTWTTNIYKDWINGQFFKINCGGSGSTSSPTGGGNTVTPSPTPATPTTPSTPTPATPATPAPSSGKTLYDTLPEDKKEIFYNNMNDRSMELFRNPMNQMYQTPPELYSTDPAVISAYMNGYFKNMSLGGWQLLKNGNLQLADYSGSGLYYEFSKDEVKQLWEYTAKTTKDLSVDSLKNTPFDQTKIELPNKESIRRTTWIYILDDMNKKPMTSSGDLVRLNGNGLIYYDNPFDYIK